MSELESNINHYHDDDLTKVGSSSTSNLHPNVATTSRSNSYLNIGDDSINSITSSKKSRKKPKRRPLSFNSRSFLQVHGTPPNNNDEDDKDTSGNLVTKSLLDDAAEEKDFNTIKESLKIALGSNEQHSNWFPTHHGDDINRPKLHHLPSYNRKDKLPSLNIDTTNLDPDAPLMTPRPNHVNIFNPFNDSHLQPSTPMSYKSFAKDIESGIPLTPTLAINDQELPGSPGKFSNIITRVSDRIAGTGNTAELSSRKSPSLRDDLSIRSGHSSRNHLSTSINLKPELEGSQSKPASLFNNSVEEFVTNNDIPSASSMHANPFDDVGGLGLNTDPQPPNGTSVAFENVPLANKVLPGSNFSNIWKTDVSSMYLFGNTLKHFKPDNKIRLYCHNMLSKKANNTFFLTLLILQTTLLSYQQWNPGKNGYVKYGYSWVEYMLIAINILYTLEMIAKVIAYGFYDDEIMFKELNLPYPSNIFKTKLLQGTWVDAVKDYYSAFFTKISKFNKKSNSRPSYNKTDSNDLFTDEIELEDQTPEPDANTTLGSKYNLSLHHHAHNDQFNSFTNAKHNTKSFSKYHNEETDDLDNSTTQFPVVGSHTLRHANTFIKPTEVKDHIDVLHLKRAYIRNSWHRIDFISIVCFWISLLLSINHYDAQHNLLIFRALSCLRILRLCNLTRGTSLILKALKAAIPELIDVVIFIGCFGLFFGIIGVQSFKSSLRRHCVWYNPNDPNDTYVNDQSYCGSYLDTSGNVQSYILSTGEHSGIIKGFRCPVNSRCETLENPYEGTVSFDNIFHSLEQVFILMSANTFTDILYITMDTDSIAAAFFYIFGMLIMTVWLLNVFIAIVVSSFNITSMDGVKEEEKQDEGIFGPVKQPVSMHKDLIDALKKKNIGLGIYYKFEFIFPILIIADLVFQCFRKVNMSDHAAHTLYRAEASFTVVFLLEIIARFLLYLPDWRLFFKLKRNIFDLSLAIITSIIIIGPIKALLGHSYYWLTVFQIMRCYRVALISSLTRNLWLKIMSNIKQLIDLTLFYFLLTMMVSVIYSRFFEGVITPAIADADSDITFDFQTLPNTFVGLYTITSTENWTDILYALQGYQTTPSARVFSAMFLIGWFLISNMVILNIFIAVIANTLNVPEAEKKRKQLLQFIENITASIQQVDNESGVLSKYKNKFFKRKGVKEELQMAVVNLLLSGTAVNNFLNDHDLANDSDEEVYEMPSKRFKRFLVVNSKRFKSYFNDPFKASKPKINQISSFNPTDYAKSILNERNVLINQQNEYLKQNPRYNKVFYVMGPRHAVRRFCQRIVHSSYGERIDGVEPYKRISEIFTVVMFIATINLVITACYITPLYRAKLSTSGTVNDWTFWLEVGWVIIFSLEFSIRVLADGLIYTPNAYSRSSWNLIDLVVLLSLWIEFIANTTNDGDLSRFVRCFKALRALRLLTISETAKSNFHNTIISGIGKILNAAILSLCLLFPFSIWGLNIFNGRLGTCTDGSSDYSSCINEYQADVFNWEIMSPNSYSNPLLHFDTFPQSFSTLFEITSLEGWVDLLINVMQSTGVGTVPQSFASPFNGFFVILYNFVGIVFILTLFISVIIHNYSLTTGRAYMTIDQRSWYQVKKFLLQVKPSKRKQTGLLGVIRKFCYEMTIEKHKVWSALLNCVLFFHAIALLIEKYPSNDALYGFTRSIYITASGFFSLNAIMLLTAQGTKVFFRYRWNIFSMFVSFGALITTVIAFTVNDTSAFANFNKLFLVSTLFFVIPRSDRLSQFLRFASASLPNLISLLFTWLVLFLVFAIALNQIFGMTKIGPNGSDNINVRTVPKALILLFKCSFGEGWNYIMDDFKVEEPYCSTKENSIETDCGNKQYAYILFFLWNIISMYIFLNMFISLILDSFSYIMNKGAYSKLTERKEIRKFKRTWQKFDPKGTGFIEPKLLPKLLKSLDGELSFHFYHGSLEIPVLCKKWFKRLNTNDPYDIEVNYSAIEKSFSEWDVEKIRERRKSYETFIEEAILNMELNREPGISFRRVLLQLPLYKTFEAGTCLNLIDFLERTLLLQKVEKRMHQNRVYETITSYVIRWKYLESLRDGDKHKSTNLNFDSVLKRRSYFSGERSPIQQPYLDDEFEKNFGSQEDFNLYDKPVGRLKDEQINDTFVENVEPIGTSTGFLSDSDDDDQELTKSGVYVPKSPIAVKNNRRKPSMSPPLPPKFFITVPHTLEPQNTESIKSTESLIEIGEVGDTLKDSPWGDTLKDIGDNNT